MATACADHLFLQHLNIPPRRLLPPDDNSDAADPYSSDDFRMFEFKVRRCTRPRSHDWTDCPFAHPGEKARRRDPRRYHYSPTLCPDFRRSGSCPLSDDCRFSHGVFEAWLHPARYRTEACKDGKKCKRKVCFFAHTPRELRLPPPDLDSEGQIGKFTCCMHCACSPRSTLAAGVSPPLSPAEGLTWVDQQRAVATPTYEQVLAELLHAVNLKESAGGGGGLWVDVVRDHTPASHQTPVSSKSYFSGAGFSFNGSPCSSSKAIDEDDGSDDPDLGWVNDLLT